jgi:DNA-damage-inducible protein D
MKLWKVGKKKTGIANYRHFEAVIAKAKTACLNSGQRVDDHFVEVTEMVEIGSGAQRPLKTVMMSRSFS